MSAARAVSTLPRHLAVAYGLLVVYACLHPLAGWRPTGLPVLDFLSAPWPKYYRGTDLVLNVLGFVPLGFLVAPALPARIGRPGAVLATVLIAGTLSFTMEVLQNFLPTRVPSNVDLGCNVLGALVGALAGVRWGHPLFDKRGWLHRWRTERFIAGHAGDLGLVLLGLWLLAQLIPDSLLFDTGDLRQLLGLPTPLHFSPTRFMQLESALVALTTVAIGLFVRCMMRVGSPWPIALLLLLAIGAKTVATASFSAPGGALFWLTPGTSRGLLYGVALLAIALQLPRLLQHALAGLTMLAATTLTNLLPENPYFMPAASAQAGSFLNFHGVTRLTANLWPFLALAYLSAVGLWRGEHLEGDRDRPTGPG